MNNNKVKKSERYDDEIREWHNKMPDASHVELADAILAVYDLTMSHKTLRMRISEWRAEQKETLCEPSQPPTAEEMKQFYKGKQEELKGKVVEKLDTTFGQIPVFEQTNGDISKFGSQGTVPKDLFDTPRVLKPWDVSQPQSNPLKDVLNYALGPKSKAYTGDKIDGKEKTYIVSGCWHFPFHNEEMFAAFLKLVESLLKKGVLTGLIFDGDILDMHSISRHSKGKITIPGLTLSKEYADTNRILDRIDKSIGSAVIEKEYSYGNHEMWYSQHMKEVDNAKLGDEVIKGPEEALRLRERGYTVQKDYATAYWKMGRDLEIIHGDYVNTHAAHAHLQKMKRSVLFFHTHRVSRFDEGNLEGHNCGWGGKKIEKVFSYMTRVQKEQWKNGFAVVKVDPKGNTHVTQITWRHGGFYYGDEYFTS